MEPTPAAAMKLHPEDPRLTAFVLGELPPDETSTVEQAIAADETLRGEVEGIRSVREFLAGHFEPSAEKLPPSHRGNIHRQARQSRRARGRRGRYVRQLPCRP